MLGLIPGLNQFPSLYINCYNSPLLARLKNSTQNSSENFNNRNNINQENDINNDSKNNIINNKSITHSFNPVYLDKDTISGEVLINLREFDLEQFDHTGITIELIGTMTTVDGYFSELIHITKDLESQGLLTKDCSFGFSFREVNLPYESYKGKLSEIKYSLKASISKKFLSIKHKTDVELKVISFPEVPTLIPQLNSEICHSNFLSMEIQMFETRINTRGVIIGSVKMKDVNLITKSFEICLIKRETLIGIVFLN
jgi:hypothetical protein